MIDEVPEGWAEATVGEVADVALGKMLDAAKRIHGHRLPYLRNANVRWDGFDLSDLSEMPFEDDELERYAVRQGDLMVCEGGEPGRAAIWPGDERPIKYQKAILRVRPRGAVEPRWLLYSLRLDASRGALEEYFTGSTIKHFPQQAVLRYGLRLPPLAEQRRIVEKVEALLAQVNAARARLAKIPPLLKRLRQSILASACSGRLTEDWRRAQFGAIGPPMREAASFVETQTLVRRRGSMAHKPQEAVEDLPLGWVSAALGRMAVVVSGQTPKGIETRCGSQGTYPWLKVGDMNVRGNERSMRVAESWLSQETVDALGMRPLPKGAVIFPKRGGAIATNKKRLLAVDSCVDLNTMAFVPYGSFGAYLWWWFSSVNLGALSDGSNVPQINHPDIEELLVPVPPLAEQHEVVRRVDALFALVDSIEARVAAATARADRVTQAILAKAFRGELVPTEADLARAEGRDYETATQLLERIRTQAADTPPATARPRRGAAAAKGRKVPSSSARSAGE